MIIHDDDRQLILGALRDAGRPMSTLGLVEATRLPVMLVAAVLKESERAGGVYCTRGSRLGRKVWEWPR